MYKEYYPICDITGERFIIMQNRKTGKFAILKSVKPNIIGHLKNIYYKDANLPRIYEFGSDYVIEEEIKGYMLTNMHSFKEYSFEEIEHIIIDVCNAVKALHRAGIVHMDISLSNILDSNGKFYVVDYSSAMEIGDRVSDKSCGTLMFSSPEHYGFDAVSEASDIYSIGKVLQYLLRLNYGEEKLRDFAGLIDEATKIKKEERINDTDEFLEKFKNVCRQHTKNNVGCDIIPFKQRKEKINIKSTQDIFDSLESIGDLTEFLDVNEKNFINISVADYFSKVIGKGLLKKGGNNKKIRNRKNLWLSDFKRNKKTVKRQNDSALHRCISKS